tara:strand:- start:289 stop:855 length:567 start_codon:yes stop_codon:yes gene_type:complete
MEQLTLSILEKSKVKVIASSAYNFQVELVEKLGKDDIPKIIEVSEILAKKFGKRWLLGKNNLNKYFNDKTLPFIARHHNEIIGYIIGVPLETFKNQSWAHIDVNLNKFNTLYTYAFVMKEKYRNKGGYAKTLKRIFLNWARKQKNIQYITGHVEHGIHKNFSGNIEEIKIYDPWYDAKKPFIYYRRIL